MNSEIFYWWVSLFGSIASLIGLPIAVWQIYKTRKTIYRIRLVSEASTCIRYLEEIRLYLSTENYQLAQIRVNDLNSHLIQIQGALTTLKLKEQIDFEEIFWEIKKIQNNIRKKVDGSSVKIKKGQVNAKLDIISDNLNKIIGETKIVIEKGN